MADNMCGPSNAAKGLTRHLDQDRSLQRDRFAAPPGAQEVTQSFRSLRLDQNTEFSSFQHQNAALPGPLQNQSRNEVLYPRTDLLGADPLDWARQFNQRSDPFHRPGAPVWNPGPSSVAKAPAPAPAQGISRASFAPYPPSHVSQFPQTRHVDSYLATAHTSLQDNMASALTFQGSRTHVPDHSNADFDFDDELRAWCAANGPEAEAEANAWLHGSAAHKEEQTIEKQAAPAAVDTHQLAEPNLISLEEMTPANIQEPLRTEQQDKSQGAEDSELAMAAQQILDSVSNNESAKFRESSFMQMMRKIAAQNLVVRDNALVDAPGASAADAEPDKIAPKPATVEDALFP
ncbi:hypothetical protein F4818DRAFT_181360 [Hypoxylon cercidicola]|nr:hypothetical protein F4818DRAFT_181360 [Hypoxylon cercidicola]